MGVEEWYERGGREDGRNGGREGGEWREDGIFLTFMVISEAHIHKGLCWCVVLHVVTFKQRDGKVLYKMMENLFRYLLTVHTLKSNVQKEIILCNNSGLKVTIMD